MVLDGQKLPFSFRGERERYSKQHGHEQLRAGAGGHIRWLSGSSHGLIVRVRSHARPSRGEARLKFHDRSERVC